MQEHYPSTSHEATEPSSVSLTEQEWQTLHMSVDPLQDPEVAAIMADKRISFDGSPLDVTVTSGEEGEAARQFIMTTSSEDPFTRDKELSEKMHEQDAPSVVDQLVEVVETYGDEHSLEDVLDDASQSHKEQVDRVVRAFSEHVPKLIEKSEQLDESVTDLQNRINRRLESVASALATSRQITARDLEAMITEIQSIGRAMDEQSEGIKSKRGLVDFMGRDINDVKVNVSTKTEEYRTVVNHLTEQVPDTATRDERQLEASRTRDRALAEVVALEEDVDALDKKLRAVGSMAEQRRADLRGVRGQLAALYETGARTGRCDPQDLRRAKLKVLSIQEGHGVIGMRLKTLPVLKVSK